MLCKIKPIVTLNEKDNKTLMFAAKELKKYLEMTSDAEVSVIPAMEPDFCDDVINLGVNLCKDVPSVEDAYLDDAIYIDAQNLSGTISGTNARSVLISVYRFLREKGYKFIRPGKGGEVIPETFDSGKVYVCEKPSYRHRGICMEGATGHEMLSDIVDWIPKVAMNEYFVQSKVPKGVMNLWYNSPNPYKKAKALTVDEVMACLGELEEDISTRGIIYHAVGHGWASAVLGVEGYNPKEKLELTDEQKSMIAMIDGKREIWANNSHNTNLCYSNNRVQKSMVDDIVNYCTEHPGVDYLHFWLADGCNNNCECEKCRDTRPADFYAQMLNAVDKKLEEKGLPTKVVFLLYYDLLWKPLAEKLKNHNRFTLMFAPISRSYSESYDATAKGTTTPFNRNKLIWPQNIGDCLEYLREWQEYFPGDSFVFDYHFMWNQYYDFPHYATAEVLYGDIRALEDINIQGFMNCGIHRSFAPSALAMNVLAETLWNKEVPFDEICENVLKAEFGIKWERVRDYLKTLSGISAVKAIRLEEDFSPKHRENLLKSKEIILEFSKVIDEEIKACDSFTWKTLKFHGEVYLKSIDYLLACGEDEKDEEILKDLKDFVFKNEFTYKDVFDGTFFCDTIGGWETELIKKSKGLIPKE